MSDKHVSDDVIRKIAAANAIKWAGLLAILADAEHDDG